MLANKKIPVAIVAPLLLIVIIAVGSSPFVQAEGGITLDEVNYSSGSIAFSGTAQNADSLRFYVTYPDGSMSQYGAVDVVNHTYDGIMAINLPAGEYTLTVFSSNDDAVSSTFVVFGIDIISVIYHFDTKTMLFSGLSSEQFVQFYITYPDGSSSQYGYVGTERGSFNGSMVIDLPPGEYGFTAFISAETFDTTTFLSTGPSLVSIDIPVAEDGLVYTGIIQTGVRSGSGYEIIGNTAIDAGNYRATLMLKNGYVWSDGTTVDKTVDWSIDKAVLIATYLSETVHEGNPSFTVSVMGFVNGESDLNASGYVPPTVNMNDLSVGSYTLTPSGGNADNYRFEYKSGVLTLEHEAGVFLEEQILTISAITNKSLSVFSYCTGSDSIVWESSKPWYVEVDSEGRLTPRACGTAVITVSSGIYHDDCEIIVDYAPLELSKTTMELYAGSSGSLSVVVPEGYVAPFVWRASSALISVSGNGNMVTIGAGSETGEAKATVIIGNLYRAECQVTIIPKPVTISTYTFTLKAVNDVELADFGTSGYSVSDLRDGIVLTAQSTDAGKALESALTGAGIPCDFYSGDDLKYWVNNIFGMGDQHLSNGDWKYWIQYQIVNGEKQYNDWTLGYYTDGGSFELVYGVTADPSIYTKVDVPSFNTGLVYNGEYQVGVPNGVGYTVLVGKALNAGEYTATLKLDSGFMWSDYTTEDRTLTWSISKATLTATYAGETIREGTSPVLKVKVTGFVGNESDSISGYVSPIVSATDLSVGVHQLTPSGGSAANYQFVYVPGNLEIVASSSPVHVHTWDDGVMTLQPTCTVEGVMTFTCTECGETYTESVPATGHSWSEWTVVTEATVDHDGVKERTCSRCGEKETESIPKIIVISNTDGSNTSIETQADGTQVKTTTGAADGSTTVETSSERIDENGNEVVNSQKTKTEADGSYTKVDETVVTEPDGKSSNTKVTDIETKVTDDSGNTASVKSKETDIRQSDGSTLNVKKTDTTLGESTTTEITANAVSADGIVQTTAEKSSDDVAEMVTQVKASEEDGTCAVSKESVQTALQQQDAISDLVGSDIEMTKVFEIASPVRDVTASIEKDSFTDMANAEVDLKISSTQGSMTMGKDVLSGLSQKEDVTLSLAAADRSSLTSAQRETIESGSTTVSLKAMAGGESIGDELGGKVTVSVKHIASEGKKAVAYYVDDNGKMTKVADQTYDAEKGEMTMVLDHFSIYTIVDEEPAEEKELPVTVLACLGMIVILSLAIMLPQVFGRKN